MAVMRNSQEALLTIVEVTILSFFPIASCHKISGLCTHYYAI